MKFVVCQDQAVKERRAMARQSFESDAVFPNITPTNPSSLYTSVSNYL